MAEKSKGKTKVSVEEVETPIHLADETIEKISDASPPTERRAQDPAAAKAADEHVTVSTIETISSPHAQAEESLVSEGQRAINLMWEQTQRVVAISVIEVALGVAAYQSIRGASVVQTAASVFLYGVANLVIGFYFGRTNHQKIGGIMQGR